MPNFLVRYPLDLTGTNTNNRIDNETHELTQRPIRAIAPTYGAFFSDSVLIFDPIANRYLEKNTDYISTELLQEATLQCGKSICLLILITNPAVASSVAISYNILGGAYQNTAREIQLLYESAINDQRPVDWNDIENKPMAYRPSLHNHLLEDVVGFEPVVVALERIRNALILSDIPAFEALIDWTNAQLAVHRNHILDYNNPHRATLGQLGYTIATLSDLEEGTSDTALITPSIIIPYIQTTLQRGLYQIVAPSSINEGEIAEIVINTANVINNTIIYWSIENITTSVIDFSETNGTVAILNNIATIPVEIQLDSALETNESFRIVVRKETAAGEVLVTSAPIVIHNVAISSQIEIDWMTYLQLDSDLNTAAFQVDADVLYYEESLH